MGPVKPLQGREVNVIGYMPDPSWEPCHTVGCGICEQERRRRQERQADQEWMAKRYPEARSTNRPSLWVDRLAKQLDMQREELRNSKTPASSDNSPKESTEVSYSRIYDTADRNVKAEIEKREVERVTAEKIALVDAFGEDTFPVNTVIRFDKQYGKGSKAYTYVAVKFDDGETGTWRTSSHYDGDNNRPWSSLVELLVSGPFPTANIDVMTVERTYPDAVTPKAVAESTKAGDVKG